MIHYITITIEQKKNNIQQNKTNHETATTNMTRVTNDAPHHHDNYMNMQEEEVSLIQNNIDLCTKEIRSMISFDSVKHTRGYFSIQQKSGTTRTAAAASIASLSTSQVKIHEIEIDCIRLQQGKCIIMYSINCYLSSGCCCFCCCWECTTTNGFYNLIIAINNHKSDF